MGDARTSQRGVASENANAARLHLRYFPRAKRERSVQVGRASCWIVIRATSIVPRNGVSHTSHNPILIAPQGKSMVYLSSNFPRTFPFQSESRRGGNPNGFLTTESEKETQWLI